MIQRRNFLISGLLTTVMAATTRPAQAAESIALPTPDPSRLATDAGFWSGVRDLYDVDRSTANLENGYWVRVRWRPRDYRGRASGL